jgi:hypothetical protein
MMSHWDGSQMNEKVVWVYPGPSLIQCVNDGNWTSKPYGWQQIEYKQ